MLQSRSHRLVHALWIATLYKVRRIPVADRQSFQLFMANASKNSRVVNLVSVEVQNWQHRPVGDRVKELIAVPTGSQGSGLGLPVAHHHEGDQVRVVEDRPEGMRDAITQ